MENEVKINAIDVQKELMKSKVMAKFSHYTSGNIYYTVELENGTYQFPIGTVETGTVTEMYGKIYTGDVEFGGFKEVEDFYTEAEVKLVEEGAGSVIGTQMKVSKLSEDLGTTTFSAEMKGSELNRWIKKSIASDDFMKIS